MILKVILFRLFIFANTMLKSEQSEYEQDSQNTFKKHQKRFKNKKITKSNFNEVLSNSFHKVSKKKLILKLIFKSVLYLCIIISAAIAQLVERRIRNA